MRISVVSAVFNRAATLSDALRSLDDQSLAPFEHIVVDGGSKDGSLEVLHQHRAPYHLVTSGPDKGIYDALNKGFLRSTGEIVGLLHSDDTFAHDRVLEKVAEAFKDPIIDAVYGDLDYVSKSDTSRVVRHWRSGEFNPSKLAFGWMPPHPSLFLRRRVLEKYGLYDCGFRIAADYDAILRYFSKEELAVTYIPEVLVKMRVGGESNRSLSRILQKSREDLMAIRRNDVGGLGTLVAKNLRTFDQIRISLFRGYMLDYEHLFVPSLKARTCFDNRTRSIREAIEPALMRTWARGSLRERRSDSRKFRAFGNPTKHKVIIWAA